MNVHATMTRHAPIKLTVDQFWLLRQSGAFADFYKSELIEGELIGVPRAEDEASQTDAIEPIKLRVADYELLDHAGAFDRIGRTELIDGLVYAMNPQYRPHGFVKDELAYRLRRALEALGSPLHVATEQSIAIEPVSEPQPDIILTSEPRGIGAIPVGSVALLIEVADSTARFDLDEKARIYAAAGVPEYWVANVNARVIHQMWSPEGEVYAERREVAFGERINAATLHGITVETRDL